MIVSNLVHQAYIGGVKKLLFLGLSCIYPKLAQQPIIESSLLTGKLEPTNEPYAIAKIARIKLCESYNRLYGKSHFLDFRSIMPTNLYGPGDNYYPENSHVIPALIGRFHEAVNNGKSQVEIWGTGMARRIFLYVDDMAAASIFLMNLDKKIYDKNTNPMQSHINVGYGSDTTIAELASKVAIATSYKEKIHFDSNKSDGPTQKLLNTSLLNRLSWTPKTSIETGLQFI
jgi:GDP-L-fucose synthase